MNLDYLDKIYSDELDIGRELPNIQRIKESISKLSADLIKINGSLGFGIAKYGCAVLVYSENEPMIEKRVGRLGVILPHPFPNYDYVGRTEWRVGASYGDPTRHMEESIASMGASLLKMSGSLHVGFSMNRCTVFIFPSEQLYEKKKQSKPISISLPFGWKISREKR